MLKATCPKSRKHKRFSVIAHVSQDWVVDEHGNFLKAENSCIDIIHAPAKDDLWVCMTCHSEARVREVRG